MFKKLVSMLIALALFTTAQAKSLIPGGESAGVILTYDGVLVTGNYAFLVDGENKYLNEDKFQEGDLIVSCQGKKVVTVDELINAIQECINQNQEVIVEIKRNEHYETQLLDVHFDHSSNSFKMGLYITDHTSAIGTITFYDPSTNMFGAFGHKIDTSLDHLDFDACELFESYVTSIEPNSNKATGKKIGTIETTKKIGDVNFNSSVGLFGTYETIYKHDLTTLETNHPNIGPAYILTTLDDNILCQYEIQIDKITDGQLKNISFHVTDELLLSKTNGIIPGMSGSPIIQDGDIVGAVTHVLVNSPKQGYGICIEDMLEVVE